MSTTDVFGNQTEKTNDTTTDTTDNPFEQLVGEGKKFKTPEDLARGKINSDRYIEQLTKALEEASGELERNDNMERILSELSSRRQNQDPDHGRNKDDDPNETRDTRSDDNTNQPVSEDTLERLVNETLTKRERENTADRNRQQAIDQVVKAVGEDKAAEFVATRARELGMEVGRLQALAEESPNAFAKLVGLSTTDGRKTSSESRGSEFRSEGMDQMNTPGERNNEYYVNLRRTDRAKYYNPKTQAQMYKDADRLGDEFWN